MKFTVRHVFDCDAPTFWSIFLDPEYNERLYRDALAFRAFDVHELRGAPGEKRYRRLSAEPASDAPAVIRKLVGDAFGYSEEGEFDPETEVWTYRIQTAKLSEKIRIGGRLYTESTADGRCERVAEIGIEAKIFGVGGAVERHIQKQTLDSYAKTYTFTQSYLREKKLALPPQA